MGGNSNSLSRRWGMRTAAAADTDAASQRVLTTPTALCVARCPHVTGGVYGAKFTQNQETTMWNRWTREWQLVGIVVDLEKDQITTVVGGDVRSEGGWVLKPMISHDVTRRYFMPLWTAPRFAQRRHAEQCSRPSRPPVYPGLPRRSHARRRSDSDPNAGCVRSTSKRFRAPPLRRSPAIARRRRSVSGTSCVSSPPGTPPSGRSATAPTTPSWAVCSLRSSGRRSAHCGGQQPCVQCDGGEGDVGG